MIFIVLLLIALTITFIMLVRGHQRTISACESPIEKRLFRALSKKGLRPICQKFAGYGYRIDLAIIQNGMKLAIECDGKKFHSSPSQKAHDRKKDRYLRRTGWVVLRFTGSQINSDADLCALKVVEIIESTNKSTSLVIPYRKP